MGRDHFLNRWFGQPLCRRGLTTTGGEKRNLKIPARKVYHWLDMGWEFGILYLCISIEMQRCGVYELGGPCYAA